MIRAKEEEIIKKFKEFCEIIRGNFSFEKETENYVCELPNPVEAIISFANRVNGKNSVGIALLGEEFDLNAKEILLDVDEGHPEMKFSKDWWVHGEIEAEVSRIALSNKYGEWYIDIS